MANITRQNISTGRSQAKKRKETSGLDNKLKAQCNKRYRSNGQSCKDQPILRHASSATTAPSLAPGLLILANAAGAQSAKVPVTPPSSAAWLPPIAANGDYYSDAAIRAQLGSLVTTTAEGKEGLSETEEKKPAAKPETSAAGEEAADSVDKSKGTDQTQRDIFR